jgi:hypothetical protein
MHFIDATTGIKDFDVWTFFAEVRGRPFPARRQVARDLGPSRFGRSPSRRRVFAGRRVDLLGRSLAAPPEADPVDAVQRYLAEGRTVTARKLAEKAAVVLEPRRLRGRVIWPPT